MPMSFKLDAFLPFRLNMLAQEVSQRLSVIYAERFGLDIPQWRILANLASRGEVTAQDVARLTNSHKSTVSRAVQQLEERGLIARKVNTADKRAFTLKLTTAGKKLMAELVPLVLGFEDHLLKTLPTADATALARGLSALEVSLLAQPKDIP